MNIFEKAIFNARVESCRAMIARLHGEEFANQIFGSTPDRLEDKLRTTIASFLSVMERADIGEILISRNDMARNWNENLLIIRDTDPTGPNDSLIGVHIERVRRGTKGGA